MRLDIFHHYDGEREIHRKLDHLLAMLEAIMATLDQVLQDVTDQGSRLDSLDTFIEGLKKQITDALEGITLPAAVQAKVDAVFSAVGSNTGKIDKALNTNVPAAQPA